MEISFEGFRDLCRLNLERKYVKDISATLANSECLFHPGIIMPKDHIASVYNFRLKNAKDRKKHSKEFLQDFEETVFNLQKTQSETIGIVTIYDEQYCYMIFYEPVTKYVLGVLKASNPSSLREMEQNYSDIISKGHSVSTQKYSNGLLTKEWK